MDDDPTDPENIDDTMDAMWRETASYVLSVDVRNPRHAETRARLLVAYETRKLRETVEMYGEQLMERINDAFARW